MDPVWQSKILIKSLSHFLGPRNQGVEAAAVMDWGCILQNK